MGSWCDILKYFIFIEDNLQIRATVNFWVLHVTLLGNKPKPL